VLGVGSIPMQEIGTGAWKSQSTNVPVNGVYILSEDQNGVGAAFGTANNRFDFTGGKSVIAGTSDNFVTSAGNFSTEEQAALVLQELSGVCNTSNGCTGNSGMQTTNYKYRLYPQSFGDMSYNDSQDQNAKFGSTSHTDTPTINIDYWSRSPGRLDSTHPIQYRPGSHSWYSGNSYSTALGFRPAGVFHLKTLNTYHLITFIPHTVLRYNSLGRELAY
jgi:hypothetical protein